MQTKPTESGSAAAFAVIPSTETRASSKSFQSSVFLQAASRTINAVHPIATNEATEESMSV
jgi:hypothetical protein